MTDYAQIISSTGVTGFYPVTEGIDSAGARAMLNNDPNPAAKRVANLPDPGAGFEWYVKDGPDGVVTVEDDSFNSGSGGPGLWMYDPA